MGGFSIRRVDRSLSQSVEPLGSKPRFWFGDGNRRLLFKAEDRETGEDWGEVVACHLCGLLGLLHVKYELAAEYDGGQYIRPGVVCENMAHKPFVLVLGNELLPAADPQYPQAERFKVRQHTAEAVCDIVAQPSPSSEDWMTYVPPLLPGIESDLDVFVGYVLVDAWMANQGRHHENGGALRDGSTLRLAPTFDHGAALAGNLLDEEREERLTRKDWNRTMATFAVRGFAVRGRSAFYSSPASNKPLELREAFQSFAAYAPDTARAWQERLRTGNREGIRGVLESVPPARMSETCRNFTLELLLTNQHRLLEQEKRQCTPFLSPGVRLCPIKPAGGPSAGWNTMADSTASVTCKAHGSQGFNRSRE